MTQEWVHGVSAAVLGMLLLGTSPGLPVVRNAVDLCGSVLSVPEYPILLLRSFCREVYVWAWEKEELKRQIDALRSENAALRLAESAHFAEIIVADLNSRTKEARITLREPQGWWNEARVNRGRGDSMAVGLPVFQNGFLVGRVNSVGEMSSWIDLLTSQSLMIPAVIEETRDIGVVVGGGNGTVLLAYIPEGRGVEPGMKVSTALVNEFLPPGIPIGEIEKVEEKHEAAALSSGYVTYRIRPGADFSRLYSVSILTPRTR
jgi:rod shape-determining protein MreC